MKGASEAQGPPRPAPVAEPTWRERLAVRAVYWLRRLGLGKVAYSAVVRRLAKRLLLRTPSEPTTREVASGLGRGLRLRVLPDTPHSYWMGTHEPDVQRVLREQIKPGMVVYDCGANIGYFALLLARQVGPAGRVFAFEPSPSSLECLELAARLNGFANLSVIPQAVWHRTEVLEFVRGGDSSLPSDHVAGAFAELSGGNVCEVPAVALDDFVYGQGHPPPDFLKLDVEGSEGKALAGARRLLRERRPPLLLEIHGGPGREVWPLLQELRYQPRNILTGQVAQTVDEFAVWITQYLALPV